MLTLGSTMRVVPRRGLLQGGAALGVTSMLGMSAGAGATEPPSTELKVGGITRLGTEDLMAAKEHGTTSKPVQQTLRWGADRKTADRICSFNRHFAEYAGYWKTTDYLKEVSRDSETTYYDSVSGAPIIAARTIGIALLTNLGLRPLVVRAARQAALRRAARPHDGGLPQGVQLARLALLPAGGGRVGERACAGRRRDGQCRRHASGPQPAGQRGQPMCAVRPTSQRPTLQRRHAQCPASAHSARRLDASAVCINLVSVAGLPEEEKRSDDKVEL